MSAPLAVPSRSWTILCCRRRGRLRVCGALSPCAHPAKRDMYGQRFCARSSARIEHRPPEPGLRRFKSCRAHHSSFVGAVHTSVRGEPVRGRSPELPCLFRGNRLPARSQAPQADRDGRSDVGQGLVKAVSLRVTSLQDGAEGVIAATADVPLRADPPDLVLEPGPAAACGAVVAMAAARLVLPSPNPGSNPASAMAADARSSTWCASSAPGQGRAAAWPSPRRC